MDVPVVVAVVAAVLAASVVTVLARGPGGRQATPRATATSRAPPGPPVRAMVYLCLEGECPDRAATEPDRQAVGDAFRRTSGVVDVAYLDEQQAYERFRELFADQPDLLATVRPGDLPAMFQATLADRSAFPALRRRPEAMPGVDTVHTRVKH